MARRNKGQQKGNDNMIEISASSEVIEQLINEEKRDIEGINRAESIKQVQQFILDKQTTGLDDEKINAVNKRYIIILVIALATLIASAIGLGYETGCIVIVLASLYYTLVISNDRKEIEDAYAKTNQAVSFELVNRADEVMRALVENRACTIAEAEALVISDDNKSKELKNI